MKKYFYIRKTSTLADDDDSTNGSVTIPTDNLMRMAATADTQLTLYVKPLIRSESDAQDGNVINNDTIDITIPTNGHKAMMQSIVNEITNGKNPVIILYDAVASETFDTNITGVAGTWAAALS